jgi:hypothetical protein
MKKHEGKDANAKAIQKAWKRKIYQKFFKLLFKLLKDDSSSMNLRRLVLSLNFKSRRKPSESACLLAINGNSMPPIIVYRINLEGNKPSIPIVSSEQFILTSLGDRSTSPLPSPKNKASIVTPMDVKAPYMWAPAIPEGISGSSILY